MGKRVTFLVAGSPSFGSRPEDFEFIESTLDALAAKVPLTNLVHACGGLAATIAKNWASRSGGIREKEWFPQWNDTMHRRAVVKVTTRGVEYDGRAKFSCIDAMMAEARPDIGVIFPGTLLTAYTCMLLRSAGVEPAVYTINDVALWAKMKNGPV